MPEAYIKKRDTCYAGKRTKNSGKLTKKDKQDCQRMAAIWYLKKYGKPIKHASKDYVVVDSDGLVLKDLAKALSVLDFDIVIPVDAMDIDKLEVEATNGIARATTFLVEDLKIGDSIESIGLSKAEVKEGIKSARVIDYDTEGDKIPDHTIDDFLPNEEEAKQKDLMYVSFKLVHVGGNKNKDFFTEEELSQAQFTPILKPLNWQHGEPNIGTIYLSKLIAATDNESAYIKCAAAIYKYKYLDYAQEIMNRYNNDNLLFSMEVWFTEFECSICNAMYKYNDYETCKHLQERFNGDNKAFRILHNLTFAGAGVVEKPADELADSISVANITQPIFKESNNDDNHQIDDNVRKEVSDMAKTYTDEEIHSMISEKLNPIEINLEKASNDLKTAVSERDAAVAKITELESNIEEKNVKIEETVAEMDNLRKEFEVFKKEAADEKNLASRLAELTSLDINLPEDEDEAKAFVDRIKIIDDDAFDLIKKTLTFKAKEDTSSNQTIDNSNTPVNDNDSNSENDDNNSDSSQASDTNITDIPVGANVQASTSRMSTIQEVIRKTIRGE